LKERELLPPWENISTQALSDQWFALAHSKHAISMNVAVKGRNERGLMAQSHIFEGGLSFY
jgi:hypothetical protein